MRRPARSPSIATAALLAAFVVLAALAGLGHVRADLHGTLALSRQRVLVGGPSASHAQWAQFASPTDPYGGPTPDIACDTGSMPETVQGQAPKADYDSGRAAQGYFCNARMISHFGNT